MRERRPPIVLLGLALPLWIGLALGLMLVTPRMEAVFTDFGVALPVLAIAAINASRWLRGADGGLAGVWLVGPLYLVAFLVPVMVACAKPRSSGPRLLLLLLALACGLGVLFVAVAIGAPYLRLLEALAESS
ncbi:MAG: hypothetical protein AAGK04_00475 [Planctomycetota bacterium]